MENANSYEMEAQFIKNMYISRQVQTMFELQIFISYILFYFEQNKTINVNNDINKCVTKPTITEGNELFDITCPSKHF